MDCVFKAVKHVTVTIGVLDPCKENGLLCFLSSGEELLGAGPWLAQCSAACLPRKCGFTAGGAF